ncbi:MAG TPA: TIGR02266 family protein [Polyangiales bacterium]|nr:TIGR02266 family protein [Polyangiales bacterium]
MGDARKDRRTLLSLKIRYKSATLEDFIERYSNDISQGGVFIKAKKPLAVGTLLKFEFLLNDQSPLIHGVGRVVWRRDEEEADADNPAGMGIKFIKMDSESRAVVQRIAEDRGRPGVFDQGKEGLRVGSLPSDSEDLPGADATKVRHVSEFLASALEEGGAGEAATRAARAGVEQARQRSGHLGGDRRAAARGAFSAPRQDAPERGTSTSEAPSRGAMSAFGGSMASASAGRRSSAAPALDPYGEEDDFLDEETTKVKELPVSDFPDADATVVSKDVSPFFRERQPTPVVPMASASSSPLEDAVPDLFESTDIDSFGPAPGEHIDPRLLDPAVATVPPRAANAPDPVSDPGEVFKVPKAAPPVEDPVRARERQRTRGWLALLLLMLLLLTAAVAALRFGLLDELIDRWVPDLSVADAPAGVSSFVAQPSRLMASEDGAARVADAKQDAPPQPVAAEQAEPVARAAAPQEAGSAQAPAAATAKLKVTSVPTGAFVSVNGKSAGRTPLELEHAIGSELSIFSKARGFLARREKVVVQAGQEPVKLVLLPLPYVIEVTTDPPGARVEVSDAGEFVSPGKLDVGVASSSRSVVISKDGYKTVRKSVTRASFVEEPRRMKAAISVALEPEGTAKSRPSHEENDAPAEPKAPQAGASVEASSPQAEPPPPVPSETPAAAP